MKINDVIIQERGPYVSAADMANRPAPDSTLDTARAVRSGRGRDAAPPINISTGASGFPTAGPGPGEAPQPTTTNTKKTTTTAKSDPAVKARQQELIAAGAKIKADGIMGPATRAAEKQFGGSVDAAKGSQTPGTATTVTNPAQANQNAPAEEPRQADTASTAPASTRLSPPAPSADLDRLKQLAIGQNTLNQQASQQGAAMAQAANPEPAQAAQPTDQPAAPPVASPDKKPVTSASDDEMMWRQKNPAWTMGAVQYPGPGNWDPNSGRTTNAATKSAAAGPVTNPWDGKDPVKAAAWAALPPEDQKWIGKADPTDKFILARSPSKGGVAGSLTPNFMKKESSPEQALENSDIALLRKLSGLL